MLFVRVHLAKSFFSPFGQEDRIVTESASAAWRPDQRSAHDAFVDSGFAVGPGDGEHAIELCSAVGSGADRLKQALDLAHRHIPVATGIALEPLPFGPIGGVDAGPSVKGIDREPAIVGEGWQLGRLSRRAGLDQSVLDEGRARFLGFGQAEIARRNALQPERRKQGGNLPQLARVVGGDDELAVIKLPDQSRSPGYVFDWLWDEPRG